VFMQCLAGGRMEGGWLLGTIHEEKEPAGAWPYCYLSLPV
jgi:hypothetical protein